MLPPTLFILFELISSSLQRSLSPFSASSLLLVVVLMVTQCLLAVVEAISIVLAADEFPAKKHAQ